MALIIKPTPEDYGRYGIEAGSDVKILDASYSDKSLSGELELFLEGYFIDTKLELPTCRKQSNIDYIRYFFEIDEHIIAAAAGILSDARVLVDQAQILAQQNRVTYNSPIEPISVTRMIADRKQMATQYGGVRPYGVAILLAGVNKGEGHLYTTDVTGNYTSFKANAIGENDERIKEYLRRDYKETMTIEEGIKFAMKIFKELLEKNFDVERFEAVYIKKDGEKLKRMQGDALKKYIK